MPYKQPPKEHQFKKGQSGNLKGRTPEPLKKFLRTDISNMTDEQKRKWIKDIPKLDQWKMAEGNPATSSEIDLTSKGKALPILVKFLDGDDEGKIE